MDLAIMDAIDSIEKSIAFNHAKRTTSEQALHHAYFSSTYSAKRPRLENTNEEHYAYHPTSKV